MEQATHLYAQITAIHVQLTFSPISPLFPFLPSRPGTPWKKDNSITIWLIWCINLHFVHKKILMLPFFHQAENKLLPLRYSYPFPFHSPATTAAQITLAKEK